MYLMSLCVHDRIVLLLFIVIPVEIVLFPNYGNTINATFNPVILEPDQKIVATILYQNSFSQIF